MRQKTILILNGSHSDLPLIQAAKRLGFHTVTTGNNPALIGHRHADEYHPPDFSDHKAVLRLAERLGVDAVCACANDFGALTAAYVAERLGLPGHDPYEAALVLHHKHRFKAFALAEGIATPMARIVRSPAEAEAIFEQVTYPAIVKPVDLTGGKGVTRIAGPDDYRAAIRHAAESSRSGITVVEDFIAGTYHSLTTFILNGKVVFHYSDNEHAYLNPFLVATSAGPATGIERVRGGLIAEAERIAGTLRLRDGVLHLQYIQRDGAFWIIEVTRRCSGDMYPYPVNHAAGICWEEWIVRAEAGMDCSAFPRAEQRGFFGRHCVMADRNGTIRAVSIDDSLRENIIDRFEIMPCGATIQDFMTEKQAIYLLRYGSAEEMQAKAPRLNTLIRLTVG